MIENGSCSSHILTANAAIDQAIVSYDVWLAGLRSIDHQIVNLESLVELVGLAEGLNHCSVNDCVSSDAHPASALNQIEFLLGKFNITIIYVSVDQAAKGNVVIGLFVLVP